MSALATIPPIYVPSDSRDRGLRLVVRDQPLSVREGSSTDDAPGDAAAEHCIAYAPELTHDEMTYPLRAPLKLEVEQSDEGVSVFAPLLRIGGSGETYEAALNDLADSALRLWLEFRDDSEDQLHESARRLRSLLAAIFE